MPERDIKEVLAQKLFSDMLNEEGLKLHKLDYAEQFQNIVGLKQNRNYPPFIHDMQQHKHDFILKKGDNLLFLQVRYADNPLDLKKLSFEPELGNAVIIFITPEEPCFRIAFVNEFAENGTLRPLENNEIITISESTISKYSKIIKKRFS